MPLAVNITHDNPNKPVTADIQDALKHIDIVTMSASPARYKISSAICHCPKIFLIIALSYYLVAYYSARYGSVERVDFAELRN